MTDRYTYLTMRQLGFKPTVIYNRLRTIGLTIQDCKLVVADIQKWVHQCGVEWAVDHLKKVKTAFINRMSGTIKSIPWFKMNSRGLPSNSFALLAKYSDAKIVKAINVYKVFLYTEIRDFQRDKFLGAIKSSRSLGRGMMGPDSIWVRSKRLVASGMTGLTGIREIGTIRSVAELPPVRQNGTYSTTQGNQPWNVVQIIKQTFNLFALTSVLSSFPSLVGVLPIRPEYRTDHGAGNLMARPPLRTGGDMIVGTVSCSQEPGGKLRHFASPFQAFQLALEPAKNALFGKLKVLEQDCTYDHSRGVEAIRKALSDGKVCYSVDLSSATDRFPLDLQLEMLSHTEIARESQLMFHFLARGLWRCSDSMIAAGYPETIRWEDGQPLGLGPSFAVFSLTHHALVRGLANKLGLPYSYAILGDDIVIWESALAEAYLDMMSELGCPVALDKTITSSVIAEFAGEVISRDASYVSTKHRQFSEDNFLEYGVLFGESALGEIRLEMGQLEELLTVLAPIPETAGGLGWNPRGLSLDVRLSDPKVLAAFNAINSLEKEPKAGRDVQLLAREHLKVAGLASYIVDPEYGSALVAPGQFETEGQRLVREDLVEQQKESYRSRYDEVIRVNAVRQKRRLEHRDRVAKAIPKTENVSLLQRLRTLLGI